MYIATQYADLCRHLTQYGENVVYPVDNISTIQEHLEIAQIDDTALYLDSSSNVPKKSLYQSHVPAQAHIAKMWTNQDVPSCDCCLP
jgi:hypothetical protein